LEILFLIPPGVFQTEINFLSLRLNENKTLSNLFYLMFCVCVIPQGHVLPYQMEYICKQFVLLNVLCLCDSPGPRFALPDGVYLQGYPYTKKVRNKLQFQLV